MLETLLQWIQGTSVATAVREGASLFPWIECAHVLALTLVVGSIGMIDLRLMGLGRAERTISQSTAALLPITWCAFVCAAITGGLLFSSNATGYGHNVYFQAKMALIALAGVNMGVYHRFIGRKASTWGIGELPPPPARVVGALSLCLWIAVVACGRWIGFTINTPG